MQTSTFTSEKLIYLLAFALALGVRILNLGIFPLTSFEAGWALQALDLARGNAIVPGPHPLYINLTSLLFSIFGSSDAVARILPALAGSLVVLAPLALREKLGRSAALILAFALALDSGLVALSRQIGSPMMAVTFFALAMSLAFVRKPAMSGICAGLALLSGPSIWIGLIGLAISLGVSRLLGISLRADETSKAESPETVGTSLRTGIAYAVGTFLLMGSLFSFFPNGLGAFANSLTAFWAGWTQPAGEPFLKMLAALAIYSPLALIFGIVAFFIEWRRDRNLFVTASIWILALLGISLLYPERGVGEIVWVTVPLWVLAAKAIAANLDDGLKNPISLGQTVAILFLLSLFWLTLSGLRFTIDVTQRMQIFLILGILVLAGLSALFVGMGWSWNFARNGTVLGVLAALGVYSISGMFGATQWRSNSPLELWTPIPGAPSNRLFESTVRDLSLSFAGEPNSLEIISLVDSPSIRWKLREYPNASFVEVVAAGGLPATVVTDADGDQLSWTASYRGQDFSWEIAPGWFGVLPANWVEWLVAREAPLQTDHVIIWARSDLFPGEPKLPEAGEQPLDESGDGDA